MFSFINRRNISGDISNKFNSTIEIVVRCHVAAAINYFGMKSVGDTPVYNAFPTNVVTTQQWKNLQRAGERDN